MGFITLVVANLLLIVATRSRNESFLTILARPNRVFWVLSLVTLVGLAAAAILPAVATAFRFEAPPLLWLAASAFAAAIAVSWLEVVKRLRRPHTTAPETIGKPSGR